MEYSITKTENGTGDWTALATGSLYSDNDHIHTVVSILSGTRSV